MENAPWEVDALILGCGYLGHRVARIWQSGGLSVAAVTRSSQKAEIWRREGLFPVIGELGDPASFPQLPSAKWVLFAVGYDRQGGYSQAEIAVTGLEHVLRKMHGRCEQFVLISSSSVYGQSDGSWVDETSPTEPVQPGGQCCLAAEHRLGQLKPGARNTILRLSGIYGPGRLLSRISTLQAGEPLSGLPEAWLNLIHVDDAARVVDRVYRHPPGQDELYLVTDDRPLPREEYYRALATLAGAPEPRFDSAQPAKRGSGGVNKRCSNRKLRESLGVSLQYPTIAQGLPHAMASSQE